MLMLIVQDLFFTGRFFSGTLPGSRARCELMPGGKPFSANGFSMPRSLGDTSLSAALGDLFRMAFSSNRVGKHRAHIVPIAWAHVDSERLHRL